MHATPPQAVGPPRQQADLKHGPTTGVKHKSPNAEMTTSIVRSTVPAPSEYPRSLDLLLVVEPDPVVAAVAAHDLAPLLDLLVFLFLDVLLSLGTSLGLGLLPARR